MNSLNKVQLIGNVTANPEIRETPTGNKVATVSVATNRVWKDAAGTKQEVTEFHNVVLWRGLAELMEKYVTKGQKVYIDGYLQTRSWEDNAGAKRYRTEIIADNLILLSKKDGGTGREMPPDMAANTKKDEEIKMEDIPFRTDPECP